LGPPLPREFVSVGTLETDVQGGKPLLTVDNGVERMEYAFSVDFRILIAKPFTKIGYEAVEPVFIHDLLIFYVPEHERIYGIPLHQRVKE
jgi:hypothetical protein